MLHYQKTATAQVLEGAGCSPGTASIVDGAVGLYASAKIFSAGYRAAYGFSELPSQSRAPLKTKEYVNTPIYEKNVRHIFRKASGHLCDTPQNRKLLIETASNPKNFLGIDRFDNIWHAAVQKDGTQIWTVSRKGYIRNGGINQTPRTLNVQNGLSKDVL